MTIQEACVLAQTLTNNIIFKALIIYKLFLCIVASLVTSYVIVSKGTKWLVNPNARVIYAFHMLFVFILPFSLIFPYSYDVYRIFILESEDPCAYAIPSLLAMHARMPSVFAMNVQAFTLLALSIERLVSTIYPFKYESVKNSKLGIALSILSIVGGFGCSYAILLPGVDHYKMLPNFTVRRVEKSAEFQIHTMAEFIVQVTAIVIYMGSFYRNNQQHKLYVSNKNAQLGARYQVVENRRLIRLLLPTAISNFVIISSTLVSLNLYSYVYNVNDIATYMVYVELSFLTPLYSLVLPFIIIYQLRNRLPVVVNQNMEQDVYFKGLQVFFNK